MGTERDYYNQISYIPKGTEFRVIGFYLPIARGSGRIQYFLVESLDNNKIKAWVGQFDFNTETCNPEKVPYYKKLLSQREEGLMEKRGSISVI